MQVDRRQVTGCEPVAQFTKLAKVSARAFGIVGERRHGHEAANAQVLPGRCAGENVFQFR